MIQLTLKDGSIRELEAPTAAAEVIKGIGMGPVSYTHLDVYKRQQ